MNERMRAVLDFWFRGEPFDRPAPPELMRLWFGGGEGTDRLIRERFAQDVSAAAAGRYDDWTVTGRGTLALILLLDQFPRNIHRGTRKAYGCDLQARRIALAGLDAGRDHLLAPVERAFFYLPLEHAEELELQRRSVTLFQDLFATAPPALAPMCQGFLDYAIRHRDIIQRFGRFPHRNVVLGRSSTAEESDFLRQPGSSF